MHVDTRTDAVLLDAARRDEAAFAVLVRRYVRASTLFAMQITHDRDDAEDIVQRAFITVYEKSESFDATRPFSPWLFGIVRRLALKRHARAAGRRRLMSIWGRPHDPVPDARRVEEILVDRLDDERLTARATIALSTLSPMQRACFELVAIHAVSTADVADMHGISEATVRQHVFRARRALRRALGDRRSVAGTTDISDE